MLEKFLKHSVGITGLTVIILALGSMDYFGRGLADILLANPIIGGLLTGTPLIPLIHSSKQKVQLHYWEEVDHSEFSGTASDLTATYEVPFSGWVNKITTTVFQETNFDQPSHCVVYWANQFERVTWEAGTGNQPHGRYLVEHWKADSVTEMMTPYPMHVFFIDARINDEGSLTQTTKLGGAGMWIESGEVLYANAANADLSTAPTAGNLHIKSIATIIIACFSGKNRMHKDEMPPWVTIVGEFPANGGQVSWPAFTNGRIVNGRLTAWYGIDTDNEGYISFGKNVQNMGFSGATGQIEAHNTNFLDIVLPVQEGSAANQTFTPTTTFYNRGPLYMKKGEIATVRSNIASTVLFSVQYQFIPDYKYTSEFSRRSEFSDVNDSSQFMAMFTVPYGMYITTIETEVQASSTSAVQTAIEIMGIKAATVPSADGFLENFAAADVEGNLLGADNQAGAMPWTLDTIPITIGGTGEGTTSQSVSMELVGDYYPPGSQIGVYLPNDFDTSISTFDIHLHIEGTNMIKTRSSGTNVLEGASVTRIEAMIS